MHSIAQLNKLSKLELIAIINHLEIWVTVQDEILDEYEEIIANEKITLIV